MKMFIFFNQKYYILVETDASNHFIGRISNQLSSKNLICQHSLAFFFKKKQS